MIIAFILLLLIAIAAVLSLNYHYKKVKEDNLQLKAVVDHQNDITFLVNNGFQVKKTNHIMASGVQSSEPQILGNVLHCKHGEDAGCCGEGAACKHCPVRFVITKSFEQKRSFNSLEASMELYGDNHQVMDVDVSVDGKFLELDGEPHMVVNVKPQVVGDDRRRLLYASSDTGLFVRLREMVGDEFRVLDADNDHRMTHCLLLASNYNLFAMVTEEKFYKDNETVINIMSKNSNIPVFVFTSEPKEQENKESLIREIPLNIEADKLKELIRNSH